MIRGLFTVASALSLLLCMATVIIGIRSYRTLSALRCWNSAVAEGIVVTQGHVLFWRQLHLDNHDPPGPFHFEGISLRPPPDMRDYESPGMTPHGGFGFGMGIDRTVYPVRQLLLPAWAIALILMAMPAWWLASWRRRARQQRSGYCTQCGYDLRASTARCPECGTPIH